MIFLSYVKMHFSYVKSKILLKWLNILRKFYVAMFTPEHSLLRRSIPLQPSGQPPHQTRLPTLPASDLATTPPCPPPYPARQGHNPTRPASLPRQPCQPPQLRLRRERCDALVLFLSSCNCCVCGVQVNVQPPWPPIFYKAHLIFYISHLKFYAPPPKFYITHLIFYIPFQYYTLILHAVLWTPYLHDPCPRAWRSPGELWSWTPFPCEDLKGYIEYFGGYVEY